MIAEKPQKKTVGQVVGRDLPPIPSIPFEVAPWELNEMFEEEFLRFRVGTCHGLWRAVPDAYEILAVKNDRKGNGHFDAVVAWFERSAVRDKKKVRFCEMMNDNLISHLQRRGFVKNGSNMEKTI